MKTIENLPNEPGYFGGCPHCGDGAYVNVWSDHWFLCEEHKTKWLAGAGLFSSSDGEDESVWAENRAMLADYQEVQPRYHQLAADEVNDVRYKREPERNAQQ